MSGNESREKGKTFERQVAKFLEKRGWQSTLGRHFDGKIAVRKHDCDIFAQKTSAGPALLAIVCLLLVVAGIAYWTDSLPAELQEAGESLNFLAPLGLLVGAFAAKSGTKYAWVECKNLQQSIKRDLIMKLKDQFKDAMGASGVGAPPKFGSWECWLVSTSRFDEDAIAHAKAHGVVCYQVVDPGGRNMALHKIDSTSGDV